MFLPRHTLDNKIAFNVYYLSLLWTLKTFCWVFCVWYLVDLGFHLRLLFLYWDNMDIGLYLLRSSISSMH